MRLIDADALGKTNRPIGKLMMFGGEYVYTQTEIDSAPTIDAVPVVRCRECRYSPEHQHELCPKAGTWVREYNYNGFCDQGQRREDGDT